MSEQKNNTTARILRATARVGGLCRLNGDAVLIEEARAELRAAKLERDVRDRLAEGPIPLGDREQMAALILSGGAE